MGNWDYTGVHGLNKYVWSEIKSKLGWTEADYGGLIPITTPQQQPEFNAIDKPYIVYSYTLQGTDTLHAYEEEIVAYTIFSTQSADIRKAVNVIRSALNRFDSSAADVNLYLNGGKVFENGSWKTIAAAGSADNKAFDYKYIRVTQASGPEPSITEGGRQDASIIVAMRYTHYGSNGESTRY